MKIKSKCPQCGELITKDWKSTTPIYLTCKEGHNWHPRQDVLSAVYIHKTLPEKEYLAR
jgi:hypothetical protein